jgi:predicted metal-dependent hydrolase
LVIRGKFDEAVERFCDGRYLEAQESFEALWHGARGQERELYQGWVLLSAALFHRDRGNARGAATCVERAQAHWQGLGPETRGPSPRTVLAAVLAVLHREWARPDVPGCGAVGSVAGAEPGEESR